MRYENEQGEPLTEADIDEHLGYVREERRLVAHHDAQPEIPEQGHWRDVVSESGEPLGRTFVIDVAYQPARDAWDEYETVGVYVSYTPEQLAEKAAMQAERARTMLEAEQSRLAVRLLVASAIRDLTDDQVRALDALVPRWTVGESLTALDATRYGNGLYRVLNTVTADAEHTPDVDASNYRRIDDADGHGVYEWVQPTSMADAYSADDVVSYEGRQYVSVMPGEHTNVYAPSTYGWTPLAVPVDA